MRSGQPPALWSARSPGCWRTPMRQFCQPQSGNILRCPLAHFYSAVDTKSGCLHEKLCANRYVPRLNMRHGIYFPAWLQDEIEIWRNEACVNKGLQVLESCPKPLSFMFGEASWHTNPHMIAGPRSPVALVIHDDEITTCAVRNRKNAACSLHHLCPRTLPTCHYEMHGMRFCCRRKQNRLYWSRP